MSYFSTVNNVFAVEIMSRETETQEGALASSRSPGILSGEMIKIAP